MMKERRYRVDVSVRSGRSSWRTTVYHCRPRLLLLLKNGLLLDGVLLLFSNDEHRRSSLSGAILVHERAQMEAPQLRLEVGHDLRAACAVERPAARQKRHKKARCQIARSSTLSINFCVAQGEVSTPRLRCSTRFGRQTIDC